MNEITVKEKKGTPNLSEQEMALLTLINRPVRIGIAS
jgi:hypothetical protein